MPIFSVEFFEKKVNLQEIDKTVESAIETATHNPESLYLFMQRYTHFNGYASAVIARLASSIGLSRYLFTNPELLVVEEADRGLEIAAQIMDAAADEGTDQKPVHRLLAQILLKTIGDYANLSVEQRNEFSTPPLWLQDISTSLISNYEGRPGDLRSLITAMGFHLASEILGDREYALLDKVIRYDNKNTGFDYYLRKETRPARINGHSYDPWCWVVIHGKHQGKAAECEHLACALNALNMTIRYCNESQDTISEWVLAGFQDFVTLQQKLFSEIHREMLEEINHNLHISELKELSEKTLATSS